jgi:hypothetical protein
MEATSKMDARRLAEARGWTLSFAYGYLDGQAYRTSAVVPPKDLLWDNSQYALGLQAGYFPEVGLLEF